MGILAQEKGGEKKMITMAMETWHQAARKKEKRSLAVADGGFLAEGMAGTGAILCWKNPTPGVMSREINGKEY
jgi:hypothetical protein